MSGGVAGTLPRLLAGYAAAGASDLAGHARAYGPVDLREDPAALLSEIVRSGLRGRGGAAFPTATKLRAVASGRRPVVVVNGAEGEPASAKDRLLLATLPHLVLDGAVLAAGIVGARECLVCVPSTAVRAREALGAAVAERARTRTDPVDVRLVAIAARYISGEESALVNQLNDGPPLPTVVPPRPFERGVRGRPTLVQNAETLAHLACIVRFGGDWFRELGPAEDPGSVLVTVAGAVRSPGVQEVALGSPLGDVLRVADPSHRPGAVLLGGYYGAWAPFDPALPLAHDRHLVHGATLGCGVVAVLPHGACGLCQTALLLDYLAEESSGQCGPCVFGLRAIAGAAADLVAGRGGHETVDRLSRWAGDVEGRGACHHPNGAVRLLRSALDVFAEDTARHAAGHTCGTQRSWFPLPAADRREAA